MSATLDELRDDATLEERRFRFTIDDYRAMAEAGILPEKPKTELLQGEIFWMLPIGLPHRDTVGFLADLLYDHLPRDRWTINVQSTIELPDDSAPEPDICVVRGSRRTIAGKHPEATQYEHIIEVSDSSLKGDRVRKMAMYAESGISSYWIVNVGKRQVEVYSEPSMSAANQHGYGKCQIFGEADTAEMPFAGYSSLFFKVADILSPQ